MWPPYALELLLQEVDIDEDIRDCVFVHHSDISSGQETLETKMTSIITPFTTENPAYHEALRDVLESPLVRFIFICLFNHKRVYDRR